MPPDEPRAGIVILHGAGSAKESHFDFARAARAFGYAAIAFDARGHGESEGLFGPSAFADAISICELLSGQVPAVALRGSSMGGFCALHAAAEWGRARAVVAICPAREQLLLRGIRSGRLTEFALDRAAAEPWLESLDSLGAAARLGEHGSALLLLHAEGDEQVPYASSQELYEAAAEPKRLLLLPGGHHRSIQHDAELQGESLRFIARTLGDRT